MERVKGNEKLKDKSKARGENIVTKTTNFQPREFHVIDVSKFKHGVKYMYHVQFRDLNNVVFSAY